MFSLAFLAVKVMQIRSSFIWITTTFSSNDAVAFTAITSGGVVATDTIVTNGASVTYSTTVAATANTTSSATMSTGVL